MATISVSVTDQAIASIDEYADFEIVCGDNDGAIAHFCGRCRSENGTLAALELEHYPGMAEAQIEALCRKAADKWPITNITVIHRHGLVQAGEPIVLVFASSAHREAALAAVQLVMDFLKTDAPFWKREHLADGTRGAWIASKVEDTQKRDRWED
ncbi:MAG: molybdenum cofactor biosynthesis protein MoaE [Pseudomonadota bacterium]